MHPKSEQMDDICFAFLQHPKIISLFPDFGQKNLLRLRFLRPKKCWEPFLWLSKRRQGTEEIYFLLYRVCK